MLMRFNRNYLDFSEGKDYEIEDKNQQKYYQSMRIAKEVVSKDAKPVKKVTIKKVEKKEVAPVEKEAADTDDLLGLID